MIKSIGNFQFIFGFDYGGSIYLKRKTAGSWQACQVARLSSPPGKTYIEAGDTVSISAGSFSGYVTNGSKELQIIIPLSKPCFASSVAIKGTVIGRGISGYINGTTYDNSALNLAGGSGYTVSASITPAGISICTSGMVNNVDEGNIIYWALQNCGGMDEVDAAKFLERVKTSHIAFMDGAGEGATAEPHSIEAPYVGTQTAIDTLTKRLYEDFQAFDASAVTAGNQTATAIKASYVPLDLKTDRFERQLTGFINGILKLAGIDDKPTYTRNQIVNKQEEMQTLMMAAPYADDEYLACALGMAANRNFYNTKYIRLPDLLVEIAMARGDGTYREYMKKLKKTKLLILDEWLLYPLKESEARDVLELVEARAKTASTIFCSQFDVPGWHENLYDPTLADAICDRIVYDSYIIRIEGDTMRKRKGIMD